MPLLPIALPEIWDIPVAVGVPALLGQSISNGVEASASTLLGTALDEYLIQNAASQWGIFTQAGDAVLTSAHVRAVDIQSSYSLSDAPIENGAFTTYDKNRMPGRYVVEMLCDGSSFDYGSYGAINDLLDGVGVGSRGIDNLLSGIGMRSTTSAATLKSLFTVALDQLSSDLNIYTVATPECTYTNVNVVGYHMRREAQRGASMIWAEIFLQEVRLNAEAAYTLTAQPQGEAAQNGGNVQSEELENAFNDVTLGNVS